MTAIGVLVTAYILGALPWGYWFGRLIWKIDIRCAGSGNIGATNLARVVGKPWGLFAFVLAFSFDFGKGMTAVWLARYFFPATAWLQVGAGAIAIAGHNWTIFLKGRGGKGVATSAGVFAVLAPLSLAVALVVFIITFLCFRIVSLGSILSSVALSLAAGYFQAPAPVVLFAATAAVLIIVRHRSNIFRLVRGEERPPVQRAI